MIENKLISVRGTLSVTVALTAATVSVCVSLLGCSGESVNMGQDDVTPPPPLPAWSRCLGGTSIEGDVIVRNQEELAALEGCQEIEGNLDVVAFEGADLRPLHALTAVRESLNLGTTDYRDDGGWDAAEQALAEHWLESLHGLESLESVGELQITGYAGRDVDPLGNLRLITGGRLMLQLNSELEGLEGLRNAGGINNLEVTGCPALQSIAPLALPELMTYLSLDFSGISQLELDVRSIRGLSIDHTQLRNLDGLSNLVDVGYLRITANFSLENVDGLNGLSYAEAIDFEYNNRLTHLPDFPDLSTLDSLRVKYEERLTALPAFPMLRVPPFREYFTEQPEALIATRPDLIEIIGNKALTALTLPPAWLSASAVLIEQNPALARIDFTEQSFIDYLSIRSNAVLGSVGLGALDAVNHLDVLDNPNLPPSAFDPVRTLRTDAAGGAAHP